MYDPSEFHWRGRRKYYDYEKHARTQSDFKPAFCKITISVSSESAWRWLQDCNVLVPHSPWPGFAKKWYWKGPIYGVEYWKTPNGEREICYQATVSDIPSGFLRL